MADDRVCFIDMTRPGTEGWCHVFKNGHVDFESTDAEYDSQDEALAHLEADGWTIAGYDHE